MIEIAHRYSIGPAAHVVGDGRLERAVSVPEKNLDFGDSHRRSSDVHLPVTVKIAGHHRQRCRARREAPADFKLGANLRNRSKQRARHYSGCKGLNPGHTVTSHR